METVEEKKPQYKHLRFKNKKELDKWISQVCVKQILFEDYGQDLITIWVDKAGEILNANAQQDIWNGRFIDMKSVALDKPIKMWNNETGEWDVMNRLVVEETVV